jgi:hypothetical protein
MPQLDGAIVGDFYVGEEYVGDLRVSGCPPSAICGIPVVGAGTCGAMWVCPQVPLLNLFGDDFRLLDEKSIELRFSKPVLTLVGRALQTVADQAPPARKTRLILVARQAKLGIDQTLRVNKATLYLFGRTAWGHVPGLVPTVPEEEILVPTVPEEEVLVATVPASDTDEEWILRPTEEEYL